MPIYFFNLLFPINLDMPPYVNFRLFLSYLDVAKSLNNLVGLYKTQGQYAQAEPLYKRSLAIAEQSLGPDHPAFALLRDAIGIILSSSFDVILRSFCMIAFGSISPPVSSSSIHRCSSDTLTCLGIVSDLSIPQCVR